MASAAILVGGQARRFGGLDKSTLVVGGRTILDYQIRELSQIVDDVLLVGSGRAKPAPAGLRLIVDRHPDCGPLGGLDAALAEARDDAVIVVAVTGVLVRAPLARVPENAMKFAVGIMLTSFGIFWGAEGAGVSWPGQDAALLVLVPVVALVALCYTVLLRPRAVQPASAPASEEVTSS